MESYAPYVWLAVFVIMSIIEACTFQLVSIWFAVAAVVSLVLSLFGLSITVQVVAFLVVSLALLVVTYPFVKKFVNGKKTKTNSDRYIDEKGVVIEKIDNIKGQGQVNVLGSIWTARSLENEVIEKDSLIKVEKIEGVKLIVTKFKEEL